MKIENHITRSKLGKKLAKRVSRLLEILQETEVTSEGREFNPTRIMSYRAHRMIELKKIMPEMERLANEINKD